MCGLIRSCRIFVRQPMRPRSNMANTDMWAVVSGHWAAAHELAYHADAHPLRVNIL